mmetsp:Transcript_35181/g.60244  ORF Transcript_35181/g.60244 Transcript_35181/m.60244 type:complete len:265 (-) Transcript_35181:453-1247(-)
MRCSASASARRPPNLCAQPDLPPTRVICPLLLPGAVGAARSLRRRGAGRQRIGAASFGRARVLAVLARGRRSKRRGCGAGRRAKSRESRLCSRWRAGERRGVHAVRRSEGLGEGCGEGRGEEMEGRLGRSGEKVGAYGQRAERGFVIGQPVRCREVVVRAARQEDVVRASATPWLRRGVRVRVHARGCLQQQGHVCARGARGRRACFGRALRRWRWKRRDLLRRQVRRHRAQGVLALARQRVHNADVTHLARQRTADARPARAR